MRSHTEVPLTVNQQNSKDMHSLAAQLPSDSWPAGSPTCTSGEGALCFANEQALLPCWRV